MRKSLPPIRAKREPLWLDIPEAQAFCHAGYGKGFVGIAARRAHVQRSELAKIAAPRVVRILS